jgi:hypothetical protein
MGSLATLPWSDHQYQYSPTIIFQKSLSMEESISGFVMAAPCSFSPPVEGADSQKIPRCRSQPCVLTKSGVKRRRDELVTRPTVDFNKMKEVGSSVNSTLDLEHVLDFGNKGQNLSRFRGRTILCARLALRFSTLSTMFRRGILFPMNQNG